jgi:hypothetical protein
MRDRNRVRFLARIVFFRAIPRGGLCRSISSSQESIGSERRYGGGSCKASRFREKRQIRFGLEAEQPFDRLWRGPVYLLTERFRPYLPVRASLEFRLTSRNA